MRPVDRIREKLRNVEAEGDHWKGSCPVPDHGQGRGDRNPSLHFGEKPDGKVWLKCRAECTEENVLAALGLTWKDKLPQNHNNGHKKRGGKITAVYDYHGEDGKVRHQVVRYEPKDFKQRQSEDNWSLKGVETVLYRLPQIKKAAQAGETILVAEGEEDVHALEREGWTATTNPMGAGYWRDAFSEHLRGARVIVTPDADGPGRIHAEKVATSLHRKAGSIRVVELPGLGVGGDVRDWFEGGGTNEDLLKLISETPEWEPDAPTEERQKHFFLTDLGNAERFADQYGDDARYVYPWSNWLVWSGSRWEVDESGEVMRRAKNTVRSIYAEAAEVDDADRRKETAAHAKRSEAKSRIEAILGLAQSEPGIPVMTDELDTDGWVLNCENGTVDLRTGELYEHDRNDLITKLAPVEYDPEAEAPEWEAFLERILPNPEVREFMRRMVGYALTGVIRDHVLPVLYGSGSNGKSTFLNTLTEMLGDYGQSMAPDLLLAKKDSHPTELADLFGARMVTSVEVEDKRRFNEALVKRLTGDDPIKARLMRQDFWQFDPTHKPFLAVNHKPDVGGTDHAIWRRIKLVPFTVSIPDSEQDKELPEKLRNELPGILAWAVQGCLDWQRDGLGEPEEVKQATQNYRTSMDKLAGFIDERCVVGESVWSKFGPLYEAYVGWCEDSGERAESKRRFGDQLSERDFNADRGSRNVPIRRGIGLREEE